MATLMDDVKTDLDSKVEVITESEDFRLDTLCRCDRCSAQAYFEVTLTSGGKLLFCSHHYAKNRSSLLPVSTKVRDESKKLR